MVYLLMVCMLTCWNHGQYNYSVLAENLARLSTLRSRSGQAKIRTKSAPSQSSSSSAQKEGSSKSSSVASEKNSGKKSKTETKAGKKRGRTPEKTPEGKSKAKGGSKKGTPPSAFFLFSVVSALVHSSKTGECEVFYFVFVLFLFLQYRRPQLMQEDKGLKPSEAATRAGQEWRAMTPEEKRVSHL